LGYTFRFFFVLRRGAARDIKRIKGMLVIMHQVRGCRGGGHGFRCNKSMKSYLAWVIVGVYVSFLVASC
jgi:hypothetical protein